MSLDVCVSLVTLYESTIIHYTVNAYSIYILSDVYGSFMVYVIMLMRMMNEAKTQPHIDIHNINIHIYRSQLLQVT